MKKYFITGYTGFIGQNLLPYLRERGIHVTGYSRSSASGAKHRPDETYDVLPDMLEGYDVVIHLAGKAHDTKNEGLREDYIKANVDLTKALYDRFLQSNAGKFIFLSSVKAVADHAEEPLHEEVDPAPGSVYGETKLMAESYILANAPRDRRQTYILRPCMIHGPGNKGNLNLLHTFVMKGLPVPFGAVHNKRSFLSVGNLCMILYELSSRPISGGIYHLSDNGSLSTADLVRLLSAFYGLKARIWNIPPWILYRLGKIGDLLQLPVNSNTISKLAGSYIVDNHKILEALGQPLPISLTDGLKLTFQSFSAEK